MKCLNVHRISIGRREDDLETVEFATKFGYPEQGEANRMKKNYERPTIVHTEKLEARAVVCAKAGSAGPDCGAGPIQS